MVRRIANNHTVDCCIIGEVSRPASHINPIEQWRKSSLLFLFTDTVKFRARNFTNVNIPEFEFGSMSL